MNRPGTTSTNEGSAYQGYCECTPLAGKQLACGSYRQSWLALALAATLIWLSISQDTVALSAAVLAAAAAAVCLGLLAWCADAERRRLQENSQAWVSVFLSTVRSLAAAIDARESESTEHVPLVEIVATELAHNLELSPEDVIGIRTAAILMDIGTLGVPEHILRSPGRPSPEEFAAIHNHPILGSQILERVSFPWGVNSAIRSHHERWDGSGYPDGLKGEDIPVAARILAVADVYSALRCKRAYRSDWTHEQAVRYIESESGKLFDPEVVRAFLLVQEPMGELASESSRSSDEAASSRIANATQKFAALWEISQVTNSTLDLHDWLYGLASRIAKVLPCDACAVFLIDGQQEYSVCHASWPAAATEIEKLRAVLGSAGTGQCSGESRPYVLRQSCDQLERPDGEPAQLPYEAIAVAPLRFESTCLGSINLYRRQGSFTVEELDMLDAVARHASVPVANARLYQATRENADRDPLTGLYNLRYFYAEMDAELARARRLHREFSLVAIDLNHFKNVNDTLGHGAGDELLCEIARLFSDTVRDYDTVVRYGGDEFVVILPEANAQAAAETITRLQAAVEAHTEGAPKLRTLGFGVSFGAASFPHDGKDARELLARADERMYVNKNRSKRRLRAA